VQIQSKAQSPAAKQEWKRGEEDRKKLEMSSPVAPTGAHTSVLANGHERVTDVGVSRGHEDTKAVHVGDPLPKLSTTDHALSGHAQKTVGPACGAQALSANMKPLQHSAGPLPPPPPSPLQQHEKINFLGGAKNVDGKNQQRSDNKGGARKMAGKSTPKQHPTGHHGRGNGQGRPMGPGPDARRDGKGRPFMNQGRGPHPNQRANGKTSVWLNKIWQWISSQKYRLQTLQRSASGRLAVVWQNFAAEISIVCGFVLFVVMLLYVFGIFDSRVIMWKEKDKREKAGMWARIMGWLTGIKPQNADGRGRSRRSKLPPLPDEWVAKESRTWGKTYYVNTVTGVSVWTHPGLPMTGSRAPSSVGSTGSAMNAERNAKGVRNRKAKQTLHSPATPGTPATPSETPASPARALAPAQSPPAQKAVPPSSDASEAPTPPAEKEMPHELSKEEVLAESETAITATSVKAEEEVRDLEEEEVVATSAKCRAAGRGHPESLTPDAAIAEQGAERASQKQTVAAGDLSGAVKMEADLSAAASEVAVPACHNGVDAGAAGSAPGATAAEADNGGGDMATGNEAAAASSDAVASPDSAKEVCTAKKKKKALDVAVETTGMGQAVASATAASSRETPSPEPIPANKAGLVVETLPAAASPSTDTRICHCNKSGCELCNPLKKSPRKEEDGTRPNAAAASAQQADVSVKGMPQFRKRKPRKDLDLSACDPCGYYNGSNGVSNLCFMNAALQLLLHSMRCMPDDLNRCNQPVALSLREWVEAVLECGRNYTPGSTPKYAKMPATTSPKYTVVESSNAAPVPSNGKGSTTSTNSAAKCLLVDGPPVAGGSAAPMRVLRQDKSEKLRTVLSEHFSMIVRPAVRQRQCDACEFLEGVLEDLRADVAACTLDKSAQKTLQDLTNFILKNMEEESLQGPGLDWSYLRNLNQLADLRWRADVLGTYEAPGSVKKEANPMKGDRNCPVSFVGQMMTSAWDQKKAAFTGCMFEPFHVWILPLEGGNGGGGGNGQCDSAAGVMLEDLLERYCAPSQPEERPELFRTTLLWRLPATLVFCLRRFRFDSGDTKGEGKGGSKLATAVDIPMTLDFSCGNAASVCHHSRARRPPPDSDGKNGHASGGTNGATAQRENGMGSAVTNGYASPDEEAAEKGKHLLSLINEQATPPPREAAEKGKHLLALINGGVIAEEAPHTAVHMSNGASGASEMKPAAQPPSNGARRALGNSCVYHTHVPSSNGCMWESPAAIECREGGGVYDLTGVCYHLGNSLESGHYVAAVKGPGDQWWECNDERCEPIETEKVTSGR